MLEYLRAFDESADPADKAVFSKRSEAIVGGVQDRVRMGNNRPHNEHIKSAMEIFRAVQRKPVGASGAGYAAMNTASKAVRNFNSVSLLSFTTLTSLGDPMLTAVRSGSPVAFTKAMTKYASDPHYRSFIQNAGLAIENVVHERLTGMHGTAASKNTVAFFQCDHADSVDKPQQEHGWSCGLGVFLHRVRPCANKLQSKHASDSAEHSVQKGVPSTATLWSGQVS